MSPCNEEELLTLRLRERSLMLQLAATKLRIRELQTDVAGGAADQDRVRLEGAMAYLRDAGIRLGNVVDDVCGTYTGLQIAATETPLHKRMEMMATEIHRQCDKLAMWMARRAKPHV